MGKAKIIGILAASALFNINSFGIIQATASDVCQNYPAAFEGSFMNLMLTLDFSGSMREKLYENKYEPNTIYVGYFDPFGVYKEYQIENKKKEKVYYYEKVASIANLSGEVVKKLWRKGSYEIENQSFQISCPCFMCPIKIEIEFGEGNKKQKYYIGNYLNFKYSERANIEKLILTGGRLATIEVPNSHKKQYCAVEFKFDSNEIEVPVPCFFGNMFLKPWIEVYDSTSTLQKRLRKHIRHRFCHLIPDKTLRKKCKHSSELELKYVENTGETAKKVLAVEFSYYKEKKHKSYQKETIYIRVQDAFSFNPTTSTVEGILQKLEYLPYKPRIGLAIFTDIIEGSRKEKYLSCGKTCAMLAKTKETIISYWIYPSYDYSDVIDTINNAKARGFTPTGEVLTDIKNYFSLKNGTWEMANYTENQAEGEWYSFSTQDKNYINPYEFTDENGNQYEITNTKNEVLLVSDGAWNGYGSTYSEKYLNWKFGKGNYKLSSEGIKVKEKETNYECYSHHGSGKHGHHGHNCGYHKHHGGGHHGYHWNQSQVEGTTQWVWLLKCHDGAQLLKNTPRGDFLEPYYNCAIDPLIPVYEMWKFGQADLVPNISGNQNVETSVIATYVGNENSFGYTSMKNLAYYGSCQGDSCISLPKPEDMCSYEKEPRCGSFLKIEGTNSENFYTVNNAMELYKSLASYTEKVVNTAKQYACNLQNPAEYLALNGYAYYLSNAINTIKALEKINYNEQIINPQYIKQYISVLLSKIKLNLIENNLPTQQVDKLISYLENNSNLTPNQIVALLTKVGEQINKQQIENLLQNFKELTPDAKESLVPVVAKSIAYNIGSLQNKIPAKSFKIMVDKNLTSLLEIYKGLTKENIQEELLENAVIPQLRQLLEQLNIWNDYPETLKEIANAILGNPDNEKLEKAVEKLDDICKSLKNELSANPDSDISSSLLIQSLNNICTYNLPILKQWEENNNILTSQQVQNMLKETLPVLLGWETYTEVNPNSKIIFWLEY